MTDRVPCQNDTLTAIHRGYPNRQPTIPREIFEEAWKEYEALYGRSQTPERMLERGGFGIYEMTYLLFERCKRLEQLHADSH